MRIISKILGLFRKKKPFDFPTMLERQQKLTKEIMQELADELEEDLWSKENREEHAQRLERVIWRMYGIQYKFGKKE